MASPVMMSYYPANGVISSVVGMKGPILYLIAKPVNSDPLSFSDNKMQSASVLNAFPVSSRFPRRREDQEFNLEPVSVLKDKPPLADKVEKSSCIPIPPRKQQNGPIQGAYQKTRLSGDVRIQASAHKNNQINTQKIDQNNMRENGQESGDEAGQKNIYKTKFPVEDQTLIVDTVLVPQKRMVISSTRDDQIKKIAVLNGDTFEKGDLLVEYTCSGVYAEKQALKDEEELAGKKLEGGMKLFKLDMISETDKLSLKARDSKVLAKKAKLEAEKERCRIRAPFDGRVVERLAYEGEYTRTDRVLIEIVSRDHLNAELLIPSTWLRWVNIGSPLEVYIEERDSHYQAEISRIHGQIDPASKTIQVVAELEETRDRLLPGMSGQATLNAITIQDTGISGYLEIPKADR